MSKLKNLWLLLQTVENFWVVLLMFAGVQMGEQVKLKLRSGLHIWVRSGTTDFHEVISVLSGRDYPRELLEKNLPGSPVVVNVGAHIGCFDLLLKALRPSAKVYSFEPNPDNFQQLQKNIASNSLHSIEVQQSAVGVKNGRCSFYTNQENPNESSLTTGSTKISVSCSTLPSFLKSRKLHSIDLLKLDCEGCEYDVLEGFPKQVRIQHIVMEYHVLSAKKSEQCIIHRLQSLGYSCEFQREVPELSSGILWFSLSE